MLWDLEMAHFISTERDGFQNLIQNGLIGLVGCRLSTNGLTCLPSAASSSACAEHSQGRETAQKREHVGLSPSAELWIEPLQYTENKTGFHYTPKPNGLFSISNNTEIRSEKNPIKSWCCPPAKSGWLSTVYFYLHGYTIAFANFSLPWELISPSHK